MSARSSTSGRARKKVFDENGPRTEELVAV